MRKIVQRADRMDAAEKAPHPLQGVGAVELGHASALLGIHGEAEAGVGVERGAVQHQRGDHRNFARGQLGRERVFFQDGGVAPAFGAIELDHHRRRILHAHLVDAVLVAVQRQQAAVGLEAGAVERVERAVGRQRGIGVGRIHHGRGKAAIPKGHTCSKI